MTKGLVRANNLADLSSKQDSIVNLGLAIADYDSLKSLYTTAGLDFSVIGSIAGSTGNYQAQIDGISSTLSGIVLSGFVNRQGNGSISTSWTNSDGIISISGVLSGYSPSSGTTFALSIEQGEAIITASGLSANDLAYNSFRQANSTVVRASPPSGFNTLQLIPLQVGGQSFFVQASETPSFHIAPARMRHALDLVTGNLLGTYNSASPAWAVGPDGVLFQPAANAPVIEHDPVTLACLGARIWGVVTNLLLRSEEFNSASWSLSALLPFGSGSTANATLSPAGTLTADRITENSATAQHFIVQSVSGVSASSTITLSVFVKFDSPSRNFGSQITDAPSGGSSYSEIYLNQSGNLTSVNPTGFTNKSASVQSYGNGWYRVSHTITTSSVTTISFRLFIVDAANNLVYAGNGSSGLFVWGAQLQTGSTLGPYVPTSALTASSTADVWSITGADFSRIWNQAAGTVFIDWNLPDVSSTRDNQMLFLADAAGLPAVAVRMGFSAGFRRLRYYAQTAAGVFTYTIDGAANSSATGKTAFAFSSLNDSAASENGASVVTDTVGDFSNQTTSQIILGGTGSVFANGYIRELAIFRSRRPNANLQAMTP